MATQHYSVGQYLDKAVDVLRRFGIVSPKDEGSHVADLLEELVQVDPQKVAAIARVMEYSTTFNQLVRDETADMRVGERYQGIAQRFDTIQRDAKNLVEIVEDGKISLSEKVGILWIRLSRGSIPSRFERIRSTYLDVQRDTAANLERDKAILNAYADFRIALGETRALADEVKTAQKDVLDSAQQQLKATNEAVESYKGGDRAEQARLETARAEALRAYNRENSRFQLALDVAIYLDTGYQVGETIMAKLQQTHDMKEQVHRRSVVFFSTNEHAFSALSAAMTSQISLHESGKTLEAMAAGANKSLETVAGIGGKIEEQARQVAYGALIQPNSVKMLVDAVVKYQEDTLRDVEKLRAESEKARQEIGTIVEDGKQRLLKAMTTFEALPPAPEQPGQDPGNNPPAPAA